MNKRVTGWIVGLRAWHRWGLAFLLGGLTVFAFPPFSLVPVLVPALSGLGLLILAVTRTRAAMAIGWWFGVGHFAGGFYWITHSFMVDADRHAWLAPIAMLPLVFGMALYPALVAGVTHRVSLSGPGRVLVFAVAWAVAEWARGHVFTGFPWNLLGSVWGDYPVMMQTAAWFGLHGLGLLTTVAAAAPVAFLWGRSRGIGLTVASWGMMAVFGFYGAAVLGPVAETAVTLRIVQPNIKQSEKWKPENREPIFSTMLMLSGRGAPPNAPKPDFILWPETATPFYLDRQVFARAAMGTLVAKGGVVISGTPRRSTEADGTERLWNSALALDTDGRIVATYDKAHLVPLGEYVPLSDILPLPKLAAGGIDYSPGPGGGVMTFPGLPSVAPLICYEVIFPEEVAPGARPDWLYNLTNDAWFGTSTGPYQHLVAARFRAVEQGLPVIRAANTGISAVIDPRGRVLARIDLGQAGVIDATLPAPLPPTLYARYRDAVPAVLALVLLGLAWILRDRHP
ncbi:MAG: apolipoprotein N-acyltransferase [Magnetospiraceae bacterium]